MVRTLKFHCSLSSVLAFVVWILGE